MACFVFSLFSIGSLLYLAAPFIWIGFVLFGLLITFSLSVKSSTCKAVIFNLSVAILAVTIFECYLYFQQDTNCFYKGSYICSDYYQKDDLLGYAPKKNIKITSEKYLNNQCLYKVEYTINDIGLRVSSPIETTKDKEENKYCILFFGGSFTFGEGINDDESLPYQVSIHTPKNSYKTYNFGFHGYGPHQMLSAIEHGRVKKIVKCSKKVIIIYQAIKDHFYRAQGLRSWDKHGPEYQLDKDNQLVYKGSFDVNYFLPIVLINQLEKSYLYNQFFYNKQEYITEKTTHLFQSIITHSKNYAKNQFSNISFHVIYWDNEGKDTTITNMFEQLKKEGVQVHFITHIISDIKLNESKYFIQSDGHPNSTANEIISKYINEKILPINKKNEKDVDTNAK